MLTSGVPALFPTPSALVGNAQHEAVRPATPSPAPRYSERMTAPASPPPDPATSRRLNVRRMLLIDACGALVSFVALFVVLRLSPVFGTPDAVLVPLALVAAALCVFSATAAALPEAAASAATRRRCLAVVIPANMLYAGATVTLIIGHASLLTGFDIAYFAAELVVLAALVLTEVRVWRRAR